MNNLRGFLLMCVYVHMQKIRVANPGRRRSYSSLVISCGGNMVCHLNVVINKKQTVFGKAPINDININNRSLLDNAQEGKLRNIQNFQNEFTIRRFETHQ